VRHSLSFITALTLTICGADCSLAAQAVPLTKPVQAYGIRVAAEWEPVTGVLIGWPLQVPDTLVVALSHEVDLYVTVSHRSHAERAAKQFSEWGIDLQRVHFVVTKQGRGYYITRDWGPFAVFDEQGHYRVVERRFRGYPLGTMVNSHLIWVPWISGIPYRPEDRAPVAVASALGYPIRELPFSLTGGNVAFDGHGNAFATEIMLAENRWRGVSRERFLAIAQEELGIQQFHFLPNFERLGIQHLDCLLKLVDEERLLIKRPPPDDPAFKDVERVVSYLSTLTNVYGRPYQLLRIDTPRYHLNRLANYTNAVIVNRSIFVPLFGIPADAAALNTWRQAMPGYDVQGFESTHWGSDDALHCRVHGIWDPHMLYLAHRRMDALVAWASKFTLEVHIRDYSGAGLIDGQLHLAWRQQGNTEWRTERLHRTAEEHLYQGTIEGVQPGQTIEYYFEAASRSGRQETLPRTAPAGVYTFATASN
jgi:agmatine/peptidylarginine deiminase